LEMQGLCIFSQYIFLAVLGRKKYGSELN